MTTKRIRQAPADTPELNPAGATDRERHLADALRASEARLKTLGDNIPGGALYQLLMPPGGGNHYTYVSAGFEKIFGLPVERILADPEAFYELILEEDRPRLVAEEERCAREMVVFDLEFRQRTASGEVKWIRACSSPRKLPDGSLIWDGVATDITARKQAEAALTATKDRLQKTLSSIAQGYYALDRDWRVVAVNAVAERHFGKPAARLIGGTFEQAAEDRIPDNVREGIRQVMATGTAQQMEVKSKVRPGAWAIDYIYPRDGGVEVYFTDITERKRAEEALSASEARFRQMAAAVDDVLYSVNGQTGEFDYLSPVFERMFGYTLDDVVRLGGREAFLAAVIQRGAFEAQRSRFTSLQAGGAENAAPPAWESWWRCKDGTLKYIEDRWIPVYAGGTLTFTFGVLRDETARKRTDENLRESEERFRSLIEGAPEGIFVQCDGVFQYVNGALLRLLGAARSEELLGRPLFERIAPESRAAVRERIRVQRETGAASPPMEQEYLRLDGTPVAVEAEAVPIRFRERDCHLVFLRDITARRKARSERERLSTVIEQASEAIVITDREAAIQYVNPAFTRVTGYSREEAVGQNPRVLQSGKHDAAFYRQLWGALTAGRVWHGQFVNKRKDGSLFTEDATLSPVLDAAGAITHYVAMKRDITREIELEAQLRQAQKLESVGRLAGGVAHDFNNLLMSILGHAELCRDELERGHPAVAALDAIMDAAQRSAGITRQLLAFARQQAVAPVALDVNDHVANTLKMLRRLIGENIALVWRPGARSAPVKIDPSQLDQLLVNLVVNARDAIAEAGAITVETGEAAFVAEADSLPEGLAPGAYVVLTVSDTGCGMDRNTLEHMYEPFFTTKPVGQGTGLGLATVYGIVKQNGGGIDVRSEPGVGTSFRLYIPRHEQPAAEEGRAKEPAAPGGAETILLVEDEGGVRAVTTKFLRRLGYEVLAAESPAEALRLLAERGGAVDLLISDVVMPGMNGSELAATLTASHPGMSVLLISGYPDQAGAGGGALEAGVEFLAKPFSSAALACKVREALAGKARCRG